MEGVWRTIAVHRQVPDQSLVRYVVFWEQAGLTSFSAGNCSSQYRFCPHFSHTTTCCTNSCVCSFVISVHLLCRSSSQLNSHAHGCLRWWRGQGSFIFPPRDDTINQFWAMFLGKRDYVTMVTGRVSGRQVLHATGMPDLKFCGDETTNERSICTV